MYSDSLAEFHLPRSGIEVLIDGMHFPRFAPAEPDGLYFLAICSMRRLLNRIHRAIYGKYPKHAHSSFSADVTTGWPSPVDPNAFSSITSLGNICAELARQLDAWYKSLPDDIKPDFSGTMPHNVQDGWIRLRYWSAKHIICRPCLIYAASFTDHSGLPSYVLTNCQLCIESCRNYIRTAANILDRRTQFTWMVIQGYAPHILQTAEPTKK